jgi:hypothetical protein
MYIIWDIKDVDNEELLAIKWKMTHAIERILVEDHIAKDSDFAVQVTITSKERIVT